MKVCIHRGTHEIGGSCVEVESDGKRIVLDVGWPLSADRDAKLPLPPIQGLSNGDDPSLLGIFVSHPHQDHWGFLPKVHPSVPVFIGEAAARILGEASFFSPAGIDLSPAGFLCDRQPLEVGPFRVTPYLADHSAFDSYSLLIEAERQKLFYSGDLRAHGRKGKLFERLVSDPPPNVDVLLMEGTNIRPDAATTKTITTETDVEHQMIETFRETTGMTLVVFSAQNIDRLVTIYRAALQADRDLVVDLYTATIAQATGRATIPQPGFDRLKVFVPYSQRVRVKRAEEFDRVNSIKHCRIFPEDLAARREKTVMVFRSSMITDLERAQCLDGAALVWSLWHGYLEDKSWSTNSLHDFCARHSIPLIQHHTSGHASTEDLSRLVDAMKPGQVVPVHTQAPEKYEKLFPSVERHKDGVWWDL